MNDGEPSIVVLLDSARSAEPPHSSGMTGPIAFRTLPEAARVETSLPASKTGRAASSSAGSLRASTRSSRAAASGLADCQASKDSCHSLRAAAPRSTTARAWARTSSSTWKVRLRVEAEDLLQRGDFLGAEGGAVDLAGVLLLRGRVADDGAQRDDGGLGRLGLRGQQRGVQFLHVLLVLAGPGPVDALDVPAVGLVALQDVLGEGDVGVVLDGDVVLVVDHHEVAELLVPGERGRLGGDAFLEVAVGGDDPDGVVERARARRRRRRRTVRAGGAGSRRSRRRRPGPGPAGRW